MLRVLRVWRGCQKWRPPRINVGARIVVEISIANRGDRPPEKVGVLGVEHTRRSVSQRQVQQREQPRVRQQISTVSGDLRPGDSIQLKLGELGMPTRSLVIDCRPIGARQLAEGAGFVQVVSVSPRRERRRGSGSELRRRGEREWNPVRRVRVDRLRRDQGR